MKKKKGFTLIELIATMAIMSIVSVMIANVFSSTLKVKDFQEANCDTVQNLKIAQANLYNDIRKAVTVVDPVVAVPSSGIYTFPAGTDLKILNANNYCIAHSLRPLIYIKKIDDSYIFYAYGKNSGTIYKMTIPIDPSAPQSVEMYYPECYDLNQDARTNNEWIELTQAQIDAYNAHPYPDSVTIPQDQVVIDNIVITDKIDSTEYVYKSFAFVQAYKDAGNNQVMLRDINSGKYFVVKLTSEKISYYASMKDQIIAKGIKKNGDGDAITITSNTAADPTAGRYYEIHIDGKIGKSYNSVDTRVTLVNYVSGGGI